MSDQPIVHYQFVPQNDTSFTLKSSDGTKEIFFRIPERTWTWTTGQMLRIMANGSRELSDMASGIFNYIVSAMRATPADANVSATVQSFFTGLFSPEAAGMGKEMLESFADVLDYIVEKRLIGHIIAVNFLKTGESGLDADVLEERIVLFDRYVPTHLVGVAVRNFFPSTSPSPVGTGSPLNPSKPTTTLTSMEEKS